MTRITVTLHEDLRIFMIASRQILRRVRNFRDKSCRKNQKTHFMFNNFYFQKVLPFTRSCGRILQSQTGHRWLYNTTHVLCVLDYRLQTHT